MTARILPFRRRKQDGRVVTGFAIALEARPGAVVLIADEVELGFSPAQARELSRDLAELADDADQARRRPPCDHKFVDSKRCLKCGWQP